MNQKPKEYIHGLLFQANININGSHVHDIRVHNEEFYKRVFKKGPLGLGESYMDGMWDCERLDEFFYKVLSSNLDKRVRPDWDSIMLNLKSRVLNIQNISGSKKVAEQHYNL